MVFWITAFLIACATALSMLLALRWRDRGQSGASSDVKVYRDQLKEVERDLARGVLTETEAETVRLEVSRRLLDADKRARAAGEAQTGRAWPIVLLVAAVTFVGGYGLYTQMGAPGYRDQPMASRITEIAEAAASRISQTEAEAIAAANLPPPPEADARFLELMDDLRKALEERPNDVRGLTLLAENEARLGNLGAAQAAQNKILAIKGDSVTPIDLIASIDLMVYAAGGYVSPEAEERIGALLSLAPTNGAAQYYTGLTLAQNGRPDQAFPIWRRLLEQGPSDAPWLPIIRQEIVGIAAAAGVNYQLPEGPRAGPNTEAMAAAEDMVEDDRQAMIEGMVEGLASRLASDGGTAEEWAQLISALGVLGQNARAEAILTEARQVFAKSPNALDVINGAAESAGTQP
ncbi:MAG: c-type cytochrome biogenesis protein CcmI [Pseudomonadota bacterium]